MELRDFALQILDSGSLEAKLQHPPPRLTDLHPGAPDVRLAPVREGRICFAPRRARGKMPAVGALIDPRFRAACLHRFANHELMAIELMAFALLAYPDMPPPFRRGLLKTLVDEQRHMQLYLDRMLEFGMAFGDQPINDHFWRLAPQLTSPLRFVAAMSLTFENGNLDHALFYRDAFLGVGDEKTAAALDQVYEDEIRHVRFGLHWLRKLKDPALSDWEAYQQALTWPTHPGRARGPQFHRASRVRALFDDDFIDRLERTPLRAEPPSAGTIESDPASGASVES